MKERKEGRNVHAEKHSTEAQVTAQNKLNNLRGLGRGMEKERPEGDTQPQLGGEGARVGE